VPAGLDAPKPAPPPGAANPPRGYLPTLDGWRALAIGAVLVHHHFRMLLPLEREPRFDPRQLGVIVFFVISGFLITTLLLEERARKQAISLKAFYLRRAFRILPPALCFLGVLALLSASGRIDVPARSLWACVFFWRNSFVGDWISGHFWSLSIEEQFYLVWPALLVLARTDGRALRLVALALAALALWLPFEARMHWLPVLWSRSDEWAPVLLWGALTALVLRHPPWRAFVARYAGSASTLVALGAVLVCYFNFFPLRRVLLPGSIAVMLASSVLSEGALVSRLLESRVLRWFGQLSYSLYLWQQLFLVEYTLPYPFPFSPHRAPFLPLLCALACAVASRYLVEKPFMEFGRKLAGQLTPPRTEPSPVRC
jgi:peptidoglycan/LPS O-acetylase OafA/YrhL